MHCRAYGLLACTLCCRPTEKSSGRDNVRGRSTMRRWNAIGRRKQSFFMVFDWHIRPCHTMTQIVPIASSVSLKCLLNPRFPSGTKLLRPSRKARVTIHNMIAVATAAIMILGRLGEWRLWPRRARYYATSCNIMLPIATHAFAIISILANNKK